MEGRVFGFPPVKFENRIMKIEFSELSFSYNEENDILRNFSYTVPSGIRLAILGPSGCGKSTLFKLILNLLKPKSGKLLIDGKEVDGTEPISAVLSEVVLYPWMTVRENLCLTGSSDMADKLLKELQMYDKRNYYPHALSAGMTQKIRLARLVMQPSEIWLLDEPFNGLDIKSKKVAMDFLERYRKQKTAILITHNLQEAKDFSERLCIWNLKEKRPEELDRSCMEELSILQYLMEHENGEN